MRVLAAEDNPTNQLVLKASLETAGSTWPWSATARAAVDGLARRRLGRDPDGHPDAGDGRHRRREGDPRGEKPTAAPRARRSSPSPPTPWRTRCDEYLAAGMDGHVAKPIEISKLYDAMSRVLGEQEAEAEAAECWT